MRCLITFLTVLVLIFSACRTSERPITVYLAILPQEQTKYIELTKEFEKQTGISVKLIAQQYVDIRRTLEAEVKAGKGVVDIVEVDVYYLNTIGPLVRNLTPFAREFESKKMYKDAWKAGVINGKLLFVPHRLSWQATIYNSKYIYEPPKTWEDLLAVAKKYPGKIGFKASLYEGLTCDILPFVWAAGGNPLDFDSPGSIRAMRFLKQLGKYLNPQSTTYKENTILEAQAREEIYLHFNWPFAVSYLKDKELLPDPNKSAPFPAGPNGYATVLGGGYLAISKVAPHPKEALAFLKFVTSAKAQTWLTQNLGWMPIREEGWQGLDAENKKLYEGYIELAPFVRTRPLTANYERVSRDWQEAFYKIVFEGKRVEAVLHQYVQK